LRSEVLTAVLLKVKSSGISALCHW